jgi:hypothetical protein
LINPDGLVLQPVHYNPGDNGQEFTSSNNLTHFRNQTARYAKAFTPTHQGYAADSSRREGVHLAGGPLRFAELTKDPARSGLYARKGKRITRSLIDGYLPADGDFYLLKTFTRLIQ